MKKPNFFIIGAPKCGTTALSEYLREHPSIYMSSPKEPHYFADDFRQGERQISKFASPISTLEEYLKLFEGAEEKHLAVGEASATYLCSSVAAQNIYNFNPAAQIIVMLRNPVDLAYSYHSQILFNMGENEPDFEKSWQLQESRKAGRNIPKLCGNINVLKYDSISKIGTQSQRLLNVFPREQIHFILLDDFKESVKNVYENVLSFLNLPDDERLEFPRINANKSHSNRILGRLLVKPPKIAHITANAVKSLLKVKSLGVINRLEEHNSDHSPRKKLSPQFRAKLVHHFQEEVEILSTILERDLNHWKS